MTNEVCIYVSNEELYINGGILTNFDVTVGPFRIGTAEQVANSRKKAKALTDEERRALKGRKALYLTGISDPGHPGEGNIGF